MNEATSNFILDHVNDDVHSLLLQAAKYPEVDMQLAIRQITGKQKIKQKIPTYFRCESLLYPAKLSLEQSSSEITAKHKLANCEGKVLIDLTGGFGVDSYFFSFNFQKVIYIEKQEELCKLAKLNFNALGRSNIQVIHDTAENYLERTEKADWIYLDPARRTETGKKAVLLTDCKPNVIDLAEQLLAKSDKVMVKLSPMIDIKSLINELPDIAEIQIIAIENENKEVIAILKNIKSDNPDIKTVNYPNNKKVQNFNFNLNEEYLTEAKYSNQLKIYLYEPNAAVMKSGAFKLVSNRFGIEKLQMNSHLYTSDKLIENFPGRIFEIEKTYDFSKRSLKEFNLEIKKSNLSIRNFPITISELRKKLKLSDGGDIYVFATTLLSGKKILIKCKKYL
ncbi:MAG: class I SAM-dependent methyltransferase [Paludibacteraceae bacterium]